MYIYIYIYIYIYTHIPKTLNPAHLWPRSACRARSACLLRGTSPSSMWRQTAGLYIVYIYIYMSSIYIYIYVMCNKFIYIYIYIYKYTHVY